ncbi:MAG TPA: NAD-dependent epimerase/dehydratase family protein [Thermoanaerobaculia bacterium]
MKLLILGGTRFLGYHLAEEARARRHELTLFHRGRHALAEPRGVETILGDRETDLGLLQGRRWDAVIDTSGYLPRTIAASLDVERYLFVSTVSVYADRGVAGLDESAALARLSAAELQQAESIHPSGPISATTYGTMYGGLKVLCEQRVLEAFPQRALIVRPGVIVGPYDYTDRMTYWVARIARGGEVLAPAPPQRQLQLLDARDLARWLIELLERGATGTYNATGPATTMGELLTTALRVARSGATLTWVDEAFLLDAGVVPWVDLPLWLAEDAKPHTRGLMAIDSRKAFAAGLRCRPLEETIEDTLRWNQRDRPLRTGLTAERERELLARWHQRG